MVLLRDGQHTVEGASRRSGHVFGADDWAMLLLEPYHAALEVLRPAVIVEANDVGILQLDLLHLRRAVFRPVAFPESASQGLSQVCRTRPGKSLRQQRLHQIDLVRRLFLLVVAVLEAAGL